jgi:hypothetical protein
MLALYIQHTGVVLQSSQFAEQALCKVALLRLAPTEQQRFTLLALRLRLSSDDPSNHRLNQVGGIYLLINGAAYIFSS